MSRLNQICRALAPLLVLLPLAFEMIDRVFGEVAFFAPSSLSTLAMMALGGIWICLLCWASQAQREEEEARMVKEAGARMVKEISAHLEADAIVARFFDLIEFVNARMAHFAEHEVLHLVGEHDELAGCEVVGFCIEGANPQEEEKIVETMGGTIVETWMYSNLCGHMRARRVALEYACTIIDPNGFEIGIEWMTENQMTRHIKTSQNDFVSSYMDLTLPQGPRERVGHVFQSEFIIEGAAVERIEERPATEEEAELLRQARAQYPHCPSYDR